MAKVLQIRRGTTAANDNFTGLAGELSFDTEQKVLRVHDGAKLGGYALARADGSGAAGASFDIYSVPDDFWQTKIAQFAPAAFTVLTSRAAALRAVPCLEYIMATTLTPFYIRPELVCQTAECGYTAGDIVTAFGAGDYGAPLINTSRDGDGLHICFMIGGGSIWVAHKTTGVRTNVTSDNWRIQFVVYC